MVAVLAMAFVAERKKAIQECWEGADYMSGIEFAKQNINNPEHPLVRAYKIAQSKGLIPFDN